MPDTYPIPNDATETTRFRVAFETHRAEIEAVPEAELLLVAVDVPSMVTTLLGAVPSVKKLEPELEDLKFYEPRLLARIEPYVLALFHTHTTYMVASRPPVPVAELVAALTTERDVLRACAVALSLTGLFDARVLEEYRGTAGYKTLSVDVHLLCNGFRARWAEIEGKTTVTLAQLDRAEMANEQLLSALGERERAPATVAAATLLRQKAFTLVAKTWDEIRRNLRYLRFREGDADLIAPSIYAGRTARRRTEEAEPEPPAPASPGAPASSTSAPGTPAAPPRPSLFAPPGTSDDIPVGFPGSSPFLRG